MKRIKKKSSEQIEAISYLSRFIMRSFLIAVLCILSLFGIIITIYLGDLVFHTNSGNIKNPLFGAYIIVSPSMVPTINVQDAIVIKRVDYDQYNIGDIITFSSSDVNYKGLKITHRIVNKENISTQHSNYTTKGDNNPVVDAAIVSTDSIYGRVLFKIPKVGYIQDFFSKPIHYLICLLIPISIFIFYNLMKISLVLQRKE